MPECASGPRYGKILNMTNFSAWEVSQYASIKQSSEYARIYPGKVLNIFSVLNMSAISFIMFWDFWMFYQIFLSPQVKRWAIITYKHGIYELVHELPNDLGT